MTPQDYKRRIKALGLTQVAAGALFGRKGRTGHAWAKKGPPTAVAIALIAIGQDRAKLDGLAKQAKESGL